jgi:hypothetical protein
MFVPPRGASVGSHHVHAGTHRLPTRNLPLQSLSGRSFRAASPKANCSSTPRRIRSGCPDPASPVAWRCHSLGVNGFFRVYTLGSSSLLVCYLSSDLSPLGSVLAVFLPDASWFCCQNQKTPLMNFISPSELSGHSPDLSSSPVLEVPIRLQVPLLRSLAPPAHQAKSVYQPRDYLPRFVPPTSFLTTLTVYSAPCRPRVLHRVTLMGFLPSRVTPDRRGKLRFRNFLPLMALARQLCLEQGLKEPMPPCRTFRGLTPPVDRIRPLPVSLRRGTDTLLGFHLVGPRFYRPPEGQAPRSLR